MLCYVNILNDTKMKGESILTDLTDNSIYVIGSVAKLLPVQQLCEKYYVAWKWDLARN